MISYSSTIKNIFSKVRGQRSGYGDHGVIHPQREWFTSLVVAVVLVVAGAGWATRMYWLYDQMIKNPTFLNPTSNPTYREAMVKQALDILEQRKKRYAEIEQRLRGGRVTDTTAVPKEQTDTTVGSTTTTVGTTTDDVSVDDPTPITEEISTTEVVPVEVAN